MDLSIDVDKYAFIVGELITENKYPLVIANIITSYLTPEIHFSYLMDDLRFIYTTLYEMTGMDPTPLEIVSVVRKLKT